LRGIDVVIDDENTPVHGVAFPDRDRRKLEASRSDL
jgi:hypothetical protein